LLKILLLQIFFYSYYHILVLYIILDLYFTVYNIFYKFDKIRCGKTYRNPKAKKPMIIIQIANIIKTTAIFQFEPKTIGIGPIRTTPPPFIDVFLDGR